MTRDTVHDRIELATQQLDPLDVAAAVAVLAALAFAVAFLQEPMAHDNLHDFRHAAGVVCH